MKPFLQMLVLVLMASAVSSAADRDTKVLIDAEHAFAKATAERGVDGWMEFMAPNAVELSAEPLVGLDQIRAGMGKQLSSPGFTLTWEPTKAEFLGNGDLGFVVGRYEIHFNGADGKPQIEHGTYLTTWQHQKDGSWKVVSDIGSPDPPEKTTSHQPLATSHKPQATDS
jgi:ketosteroid isomerase-like protein